MLKNKSIRVLTLLFALLLCFSGCTGGKKSVVPDNAQAVQTEVEALDYSDAANWAYLKDNDQRVADCFLICPTVTKAVSDSLNADINDTVKEKFLNALDMEKGIYSDSCTMYSPYYRQAVLDVYAMEADEREPYLEAAYTDVKAAFDYYMDNYNNGRPIVLAGFSQGADMTLRLLKDEFKNEKYRKQLVAAYVIGWAVTPEDIAEYPHIKPAESGEDTGVVVSFNSEAEDVKSSMLVPEGMKTISINPLTWTTDSQPADETFNMGACFMDGGNIAKEVYQFCGAYIDSERGTLKVTGISPQDYPSMLDFLGEGVYHIYDYQFFYRNLQYNVAERLDNFD